MDDPEFLSILDSVKGLTNIANSEKLYFYARYKLITEGPCNTKKPGLLDFEGRAKWEAWNSLEITAEVAKQEYIDKYRKLRDADPGASPEESSTKSSAFSMSVQSVPIIPPSFSEKLSSQSDSINLWCCLAQENNAEGMHILLENDQSLLNSCDDEGMTALHWATDRNSLKVLQFLLQHLKNLDVNKQNTSLETALHLSNEVATWKILTEQFKVDTSLRDDTGELAELIT